MKILVTVKEIATLAADFTIEESAIPSQYFTHELNEWDEYALEEAVRIAEEREDVGVVVASIGPQRCEETIRIALAKGADRAKRIWNDTVATTDFRSVSETVDLLAPVIEEEDPDIVFSGVQSGDVAFAATGVALAERVGYEWAAVTNDVEIEAEDGEQHLHVSRELEGGVEEVATVEFPAVVTVQTGINDPRYASLQAIQQARDKPLDVREPDEYEPAATLDIVDMSDPSTEGGATLWDEDSEESATMLADHLRDQSVIADE